MASREGGKLRGIIHLLNEAGNVRDLGGTDRRLLVRDMVKKNKVQIIMLQETKCSSMSDGIIKEVRGGKHVN